ncbi:MAG TPA: GWxTD domain-containing protein [Terriglobia bacterium]|nr:GWxTD domain-containing protein [Terriglobia bacterium]
MTRRGIFLILVAIFFIPALVAAQKQDSGKTAKEKKEEKELAKQMEKAAKERANKALQRWLDEVDYIITPAEEKAFKLLKTDEEREQFIEQFWLRRDPSPETAENEYRDEFYTRIAYANDHYTAGIPGWKTDRGRIYVTYGRPDELETHPTGGGYYRDPEEGGGFTNTFPFERWRYRSIDGIGQNVRLEFVDDCICGEYRLTPDPSAKDAMIHVPGGGLFEGETDAFSRQAICKAQGKALLGNCTGVLYPTSEFDRLQLYTDILKPPAIKYTDLVPSVTTKILTNVLAFDVRADFIKVTDATVHTPVTLQFALKDLAFKERDGVQSATVRIHGEVRDVGGRLIRVFEDTARSDIASSIFDQEIEKPTVYQANLYLNPGRLYSLYVAIEDVNGGNVGTIKQRLSVPSFPDEGLAMSTVVLADKLEPLPARSISPDIRFVLGDHYVRPSVKAEFRQDQALKLWTQAYGLKVDEKTHKPSATIEIVVSNNGAEVKKIVSDAKEFSGAAQQVTVIKDLPLTDLAPGKYVIQLKITDNLTKDTVSSTEKFTVRSPQ